MLPTTPAAVKVDWHVPLRFRTAETRTPAPLYWRTGDMVKQLLEVGVDPASGAINSVTLVAFDRDAAQPGVEVPNFDITVGLPECDLTLWRDVRMDLKHRSLSDTQLRFRDDVHPITVQVFEDSVLVATGAYRGVCSAIRTGNVDFLVALDGELAGVIFRGLSQLDMAILLHR